MKPDTQSEQVKTDRKSQLTKNTHERTQHIGGEAGREVGYAPDESLVRDVRALRVIKGFI